MSKGRSINQLIRLHEQGKIGEKKEEIATFDVVKAGNMHGIGKLSNLYNTGSSPFTSTAKPEKENGFLNPHSVLKRPVDISGVHTFITIAATSFFHFLFGISSAPIT